MRSELDKPKLTDWLQLACSRTFGSVGRCGVLLFPVFDEVIGKPQDSVGAVVEVGRRLWHVLATGRALCGYGMQLMVVADGEFGDHCGSLRFASTGAASSVSALAERTTSAMLRSGASVAL